MRNLMLAGTVTAVTVVLVVLGHEPAPAPVTGTPQPQTHHSAASVTERAIAGERPDSPPTTSGRSDAAPPRPTRLPLAFIENQGQWDTPAAFVARRGALTARFEPGAFVLDLARSMPAESQECDECDDTAFLLDNGPSRPIPDLERVIVRLDFEGSSRSTVPHGLTPLPGRHHFFIGRDETRWRSSVPSYASVLYPQLYPGIDLLVREGTGLEYDLLLSRGADLAQFVVACKGIEGLSLDADGSLVMATALGPLRQSPPRTWEVLDDGSTRLVECRFVLLERDRYGFEAPDWNPSHPLVIDPGLDWSTFLGSTSWDQTNDLKLDASGNAIVVGGTFSADFPTTPGVVGPSHSGWSPDAIVSKLSPDGSTLLFSTYLGGNDSESMLTVAIRSDGGIVAFGGTFSTDYPVTPGAFDTSVVGQETIVTGLTPDGSALLFSTVYGGSLDDNGRAGALSPNDEPTVVGWTRSTDLAVSAGAFQPSALGGQDGFTFRLSADGTLLVYGSYVGTGDNDALEAVTVLRDGEAIVTGYTEDDSESFPMPPGGIEPTPTGSIPGLILRMKSDGTGLSAGTFFGSIAGARAVGVRADGSLAIAGRTNDFVPVTPGAYSTEARNLFAASLSTDLATLHWCTTLGDDSLGTGDTDNGFALHPDGHIAIVGQATTADFPTTLGAFDTEFGAFRCDGFISMIDSTGSRLLYSSFLGVPSAFCQFASGIDIDDTGNAVITGLTNSPSFPSTPGAYDEVWNGSADAWVLRLIIDPPFDDLGGGIGGIHGVPSLTAEGTLFGATPVRLDLESAPPNTASILVIGLDELGAPLYGGTLVPSVDILVVGIPTDTLGEASLQGTWPAGLPSGFESHLQYWMPDPSARFGWAGSNGLRATTP